MPQCRPSTVRLTIKYFRKKKVNWDQVWNMKVKSLSRVQLFATPWTEEPGRLQSMGFSRQEYWNGLPFPSSGDLPNPGIKPGSPALQADTLSSEPWGKPLKMVVKNGSYNLKGRLNWGSGLNSRITRKFHLSLYLHEIFNFNYYSIRLLDLYLYL